MNRRDDPMRSQHLLLGAEAIPGWRPPSGDGRSTHTTGNPLLGLALMFSGEIEAEASPANHPSKGSKFAMAMEHYENNHWQVAFDRFADLAEQGHGDAARMAWQMWRYGPELFGIEFSVDADRRHRWLMAWRGTPTTSIPASEATASA